MNFSLFLIICLIVFIIFYTRRKRVENITDTRFVQKSTLSKSECKEFIEIAKKYNLETKPDGVDDKPEYQIDVLDTGVINEELWAKCRLIYLNKLKPIIESTPWIPSDQRINYIFLRRYEKTERSHIPMHTDDSYITMSILLSDTKDFEGGELYVFDSKESIDIDNWDDTFYTPTSNREKFVNSHPNLPILDYQQGDLAVYTGGKNYHGTLPMTSGERYILTFFFDKSKINQ